MKLATLRTTYGTTTIRVEGDGVGVELDHADVGELLRTGDWRKAAQLSGEPIVFDPRDLAPVIPRPEKIICVGLNYAKHVREMGREFPDQPTLFIKFADALTGPYDDIHLPDYAQHTPDYEGELAVVIGDRAHRVGEEDALGFVAGYSIINDYTLRDFQRATTQFHAGKSFYRTAGFGPWLTTADEWSPGNHATLTTTVCRKEPSTDAAESDAAGQDADEGFSPQAFSEVRQKDDTDDLIFSIAKLVSFCSQLYPLNPGDVIATGTPEGVGYARNKFLRDGDTTRVAIDGLGHIANTTVFD